MVNIVLLLQDSAFIFVLLALMTGIIFFLSGAVRAGYRRAMIEHMQNMTESPRLHDSTEKVELEDLPKNVEGQKPKIGMFKVHMLSPNTAQYGRKYANFIPSIDGIPLSAFPNIEMHNPWALSDIEAAEAPDKVGCRKSVTGLFNDCGVAPANICG